MQQNQKLDKVIELFNSGPVHFWAVEPGSPQALAQGIKTLLDDPALVKRLQAGTREAASRFSWSRIVRQTQELYTSC